MEHQKIICPVCGREYMPAEIFLPVDLLGKPVEVVRNEGGKIEFFLGDSPEFVETYICDGCDTEFQVSANLSFETVAVNQPFSEEYTSKYNGAKKVKLEETELFD